MCKLRPLPRCTVHIKQSLDVSQTRLQKKVDELKAYQEKYKDSIESTDPNGRDLIRQNKEARLKAEAIERMKEAQAAQFHYDGTPQGQADLQETIDQLKATGNDEIAEQMEQHKELAHRNRKRIREEAKELHQLEADGATSEEMTEEIVKRVGAHAEEEAAITLEAADTAREIEEAENELANNTDYESLEDWADREAPGLTEDPDAEQYMDSDQPLPDPDSEAYQAYSSFLNKHGITDAQFREAQKRDRNRRMKIGAVAGLVIALGGMFLARSMMSGRSNPIITYGRSYLIRQAFRGVRGGKRGKDGKRQGGIMSKLSATEEKNLRERQEALHAAAMEAADQARQRALELHNNPQAAPAAGGEAQPTVAPEPSQPSQAQPETSPAPTQSQPEPVPQQAPAASAEPEVTVDSSSPAPAQEEPAEQFWRIPTPEGVEAAEPFQWKTPQQAEETLLRVQQNLEEAELARV